MLNNQKSNIDNNQTNAHASNFDKNATNKPENLQDLLRLQAMQDQLSNEAHLSLFDNGENEIDAEEEHKLWSRIDEMRKQMDDDLSQEQEDQTS